MAEEESKSFKKLIEEQRKTTAAVEKSMMTARERADLKAAEDEKFKKRSEASTKGAETKRLNALNKQDPNSAANEEKATKSNSYLRDTFAKFLGKNSSFAKGFASIGASLKKKVSGGMDGIFKALKAGAFVLFLGGLVKFLQSDTFKELKNKYLPIIADGLQSLYDSLKFIADGFFVTDPDTGKTTFSAVAGLINIMKMIRDSFLGWIQSLKDGFYDEEGNFQLLAGLKNAAGEFGKLAVAFTVLLPLLAPGVFFGTLMVGGKLFGGILGVGGTVAKAFGGLFKLLGKKGLAGLIIGTGVGMASLLTSGAAEGGVFAKIGTSFGKLFTKVGEFGTKIGTAVSSMATKLSTSLSAGVFSVANGIGTGFGKLFLEVSSFGSSISTTVKGMGASLTNTTVFKTVSSGFSSLFGVLSDFGSSIAKVATKAATKAASVVAKSLDDVAKIGSKVVKFSAAAFTKKAKSISGTGEFALKSKVSATPKLSTAQRAAFSGTGEFALNPKVVATTSAKIASSVSKSIAKKIPLISVVAGTAFAADRVSKGEYGKAFLEFLSGVVGIVPVVGTGLGLTIDAGVLADDLGITVDDAKKLLLKNIERDSSTVIPTNSYGERGRGESPIIINQSTQTNTRQGDQFSLSKGITDNSFGAQIANTFAQ